MPGACPGKENGTMKRYFSSFSPILYGLIIFCTAFCIMAGFIHPAFLAVAVAVSLAALGYTLWSIAKLRKKTFAVIDAAVGGLDSGKRPAISNTPLPVAITEPGGEVLWYNDLFAQLFPKKGQLYGEDATRLVQGLNMEKARTPVGSEVNLQGRYFTAFLAEAGSEEEHVLLLYLVEITKLKQDSIEFGLSRPAVLTLLVDNYDDVLQSYKDSEKARITGEVERCLENYIGQTTGILIKVSNRKFYAVVEYRHMRKFIDERFAVLDRIRKILVDGKIPITLSIGVGMLPDTLSENMKNSSHSLDMALGRGGDQAAVKTINGYDFFGGVSKGVEKRTKVRARIIASALKELCQGSEQIFIMGHKFSDLDSVGSSVGLCRALRMLGCHAFAVIDYDTTLSQPLVARIQEADQGDIFIDADSAQETVDKNTLVIVMDTHAQNMVDRPHLVDRAGAVVVIDHHRKRVDYIQGAVLFYHEPYASSTSEMVSELLGYLNEDDRIEQVFAEALLSGIVLDTKNFAVKTGVKTFEAAAYLRSLGADTVEVKRLFSSSMEAFRSRTAIVTSAKIYHQCAIAVAQEDVDDMRVVAAQAADELLEISDVKASFVLFSQGSQVNISARSMGQLNVQVILESLGGGGHHTMAGAQLRETSLEAAVDMLKQSIDMYYKNNHIAD